MKYVRLFLFLLLTSGGAQAAIGVEVDFKDGDPVVLPGDCIYAINDSTYTCTTDKAIEAYVDFPSSERVLKNFGEIKTLKKREDGKNFELIHTSMKQIGRFHHFAVEMLIENVVMHSYTVCDFSGRCMSAASSDVSFIEKLMHQISPTLIHYNRSTK